MPPIGPLRQSDRVRRLLRLRAQPEAIIGRVVGEQFKRGWRTLYPRLRQLRKQAGDPLEAWYDDWADPFMLALYAALQDGASAIAQGEMLWWGDTPGLPLSLDPAQIVADYEIRIGAKIGTGRKGGEITEATRDQVRAAVLEWYNTPDMDLSQLADRLSSWFSPVRAARIANNETTALVSAVTKATMEALGLSRWTWQTRLEFNVCDICRPLHGKVFSINDPMPPDASHIACMCVPAPVVE